MIDIAHAQKMARYNRWQNQNLYGAAETLGDRGRKEERGAFFGSIHKTLNHILWADRIWMSRFGAAERPPGGIAESLSLHGDWGALKAARTEFVEKIITWANNLDSIWLSQDLSWHSSSTGRDNTSPKWVLVTHFFNHQTHHRGQVHCLLTQAGAKPHDTDLPFMPE